MSCSDLTRRWGTKIVVPVMATRVTCPISLPRSAKVRITLHSYMYNLNPNKQIYVWWKKHKNIHCTFLNQLRSFHKKWMPWSLLLISFLFFLIPSNIGEKNPWYSHLKNTLAVEFLYTYESSTARLKQVQKFKITNTYIHYFFQAGWRHLAFWICQNW